ncbi:MAG: hypothetical protein V3R89_01225 [Thermoanaerobaculia bacterium]
MAELTDELAWVDRARPGNQGHVAAPGLDLQDLDLTAARPAAVETLDRAVLEVSGIPGQRVRGRELTPASP